MQKARHRRYLCSLRATGSLLPGIHFLPPFSGPVSQSFCSTGPRPHTTSGSSMYELLVLRQLFSSCCDTIWRLSVQCLPFNCNSLIILVFHRSILDGGRGCGSNGVSTYIKSFIACGSRTSSWRTQEVFANAVTTWFRVVFMMMGMIAATEVGFGCDSGGCWPGYLVSGGLVDRFLISLFMTSGIEHIMTHERCPCKEYSILRQYPLLESFCSKIEYEGCIGL